MLTLTNARLFDGTSMLPGRHSVTLDGNRIAAVEEAARPIRGEAVDLGGMTLMPGLISCHIHPDFYLYPYEVAKAGIPLGKERPPGVLMAIGVRTCRVLLESGFTGYVGASCSNAIDAQLKMAIADGIIPGPRIRACSRHLGTTADWNHMRIRWWHGYPEPGGDIFADGPDDLCKVVREELFHGAQTIKIFASEGHDSGNNTRNMTRREMEAIVEAAHHRGAKVRAHVCGKDLILECIELGVDIIDHGDDTDEEVVEAMVKAGTFWVPSQITPKIHLELNTPGCADGTLKRQFDSVRRILPIAHEAGVKILLGDDYSGMFRDFLEDDPLDHQVGNYGRELAYYGGIPGMEPEAVLAWGTRNPGELLDDAEGRVGVVEPGAMADLIVVDGDPLSDLTLFSRPEQSLKAVIRDGALVIDRLPPHPHSIAA